MNRRLLFAALFAAALVVSAFPGSLGSVQTAAAHETAIWVRVDASQIEMVGDPQSSSDGQGGELAGSDLGEEATYIVVGQAPPLAAYRGGVAGLAPTDPTLTGLRRLDANSAASRAYLDYLSQAQMQLTAQIESALGRGVDVRFRYQVALNGMALRLTPIEADRVASLPGVEHVVRDFARQLLTDNGHTAASQGSGADHAVWKRYSTSPSSVLPDRVEATAFHFVPQAAVRH